MGQQMLIHSGHRLRVRIFGEDVSGDDLPKGGFPAFGLDVGKLRGIPGSYASDVSGVVHERASFAFAEGENFGSEGQNGVETQGEGVFIGAAAPVPLVVALDVSKAVRCIKKHPPSGAAEGGTGRKGRALPLHHGAALAFAVGDLLLRLTEEAVGVTTS